jgi:YfiH family protein
VTLPVPITHPLLDRAGVRHGFFTREGGVSTGIYEGLNCGLGSADDPDKVRENRARVARAMGGQPDDLAGPYQIHSAEAVLAESGWPDDRPRADAVVTTTPGVICGVLTADCAPVLLADPVAGVVAAAHAGWKGALGGVIQSTVDLLKTANAAPARIVAVVGPCIAQDSYEVDEAFERRFLVEAPGSGRFFRLGAREDRRMFDLPGFALWRLEQAGVGEAAWTGHDTRPDAAHFYSNRRAFLNGEPDFGRMMSAIRLG